MIIDSGCCSSTMTAADKDKRDVTLLFKRDELLHDMSNNSWLLSEVSASDNTNAK